MGFNNRSMKKKNSKILLINGSIRGDEGNSGKIIKRAATIINEGKNISAPVITLADPLDTISSIKKQLQQADAFFVVSGTYWNNWGTPLQRFIEIMSVFENTDVFFGKPVACAVTMDAAGGMEVAARLHSVFSGFGCWSPPCSTLVISRVGQQAVDASTGMKNDPNKDVWRLEDLNIVLQNLIASTNLECKWKRWPIKPLAIKEGPWPATGVLDLGSEKFL